MMTGTEHASFSLSHLEGNEAKQQSFMTNHLQLDAPPFLNRHRIEILIQQEKTKRRRRKRMRSFRLFAPPFI